MVSLSLLLDECLVLLIAKRFLMRATLSMYIEFTELHYPNFEIQSTRHLSLWTLSSIHSGFHCQASKKVSLFKIDCLLWCRSVFSPLTLSTAKLSLMILSHTIHRHLPNPSPEPGWYFARGRNLEQPSAKTVSVIKARSRFQEAVFKLKVKSFFVERATSTAQRFR